MHVHVSVLIFFLSLFCLFCVCILSFLAASKVLLYILNVNPWSYSLYLSTLYQPVVKEIESSFSEVLCKAFHPSALVPHCFTRLHFEISSWLWNFMWPLTMECIHWNTGLLYSEPAIDMTKNFIVLTFPLSQSFRLNLITNSFKHVGSENTEDYESLKINNSDFISASAIKVDPRAKNSRSIHVAECIMSAEVNAAIYVQINSRLPARVIYKNIWTSPSGARFDIEILIIWLQTIDFAYHLELVTYEDLGNSFWQSVR